ncbi:hypothetical protein KI387_005702, partial [Taxus chinensis]
FKLSTLDLVSSISSDYSNVGDSDVTHMDLKDLKARMLGGPREVVEEKAITSGLYAESGHLISVKIIELVLVYSHHYEPDTQTIRADENS